jgi:hypothetical protein
MVAETMAHADFSGNGNTNQKLPSGAIYDPVDHDAYPEVDAKGQPVAKAEPPLGDQVEISK